MSIEVLGVSGSPVKNSNTDTLIKAVLKSTGAETKFVKLSEIKVGPCIACRKCAYTNRCVLNDDFKWLSEDVLAAKAVVIGTPVMYSAASAYTKAFIERHYSLRHVKLLTQGKIGATVVVGELRADEVSQWLAGFMMSAGMDLAGSLSAFGDPGCFNCGPGETCNYSIWNSMAKREGTDNFYMKAYAGYLEALPDNDPLKNPSYKILKHRSVEAEPEVMAKAEAIGQEIRRRLLVKKPD
jgi:multimeric flavodoxin WrbA